MIPRLNSVALICAGMLLLFVAGCSAPLTTVPSPTAETPLLTATMPCVEEVILPQITEIQPSQIKPGSTIKVIGTGGYVRDSCGGYKEGVQTFELYLDQEPVRLGDFVCYVNHCEGTFTLPDTITTGPHVLLFCEVVPPGSGPNICEFEFQVTAE
jgi:hypothetical protein